MDVGAVSHPQVQEQQEKYTVAEVMDWLQQTGGEEFPPPPVPDASWERPDNHMDAMTKGKGNKGKGFSKGGGIYAGKGAQNPGKGARAPLICHRCGGAGHPESVCPIPVGSTSNVVCNCCKGRGHVMAMCTSYGGGKFVPPSQRPRKGGKGISDVDQPHGTAIVPWSQMGPGTQPAQNPNDGNNWGPEAPWMKAAVRPMDSVQQAQRPVWKMKVIYSVSKAQEVNNPQYKQEPEEEEDGEWKVKTQRGEMKV